MEKNKELRKAVNKSFKKENELSCAIQSIEKILVFKDFEADEPQLTMALGGELFLHYNSREMFDTDFINLMETKGYITPEDFN